MFGTLITDFRDIIALVVFFGLTIFVHEFGHFLLALKLGFVVDTFSIGFGPAIWKKKVGDVLYKISWLPFGGYVAIPQLDPSGMDNVQGKNKDVPADGREIRNLPEIAAWKKIVVSVSGALGNIIFAVFLAYVIYLSPTALTGDIGPVAINVSPESSAFQMGIRKGDEIIAVNGNAVDAWYQVLLECLDIPSDRNTVTVAIKSGEKISDYELGFQKQDSGLIELSGITELVPPFRIKQVFKDSGAEAAGIKPGDIVREFNGERIISWEQFVGLIQQKADCDVPVIVDRKGVLVELSVKPAFSPKSNSVIIGIASDRMGVMPWMHYKNPMDQVTADASMIFRVLKGLMTPKKSKQMARGLGGPIAIFLALWASIKISYLNAIGFLRMLNINLAIINLFPIPVLDGGHVVFAIWESITKKKIPARLVNILINIFGILLIVAMILITYKDAHTLLPNFFGANDDDKKPVEEAPADPGVGK